MSQSNLEQLFVTECSASGIACQRNADGIISFTSPCADVGEMIVYFDGTEITVDIENITHCHFTPYEAGDTYPAHTAEDCARSATQYVCDVLNNQVVLWRYQKWIWWLLSSRYRGRGEFESTRGE